MTIREYREKDCPKLAELFYQTVHKVNARDYTKEQLDVWASGKVDLEGWNRSFLEHITLVAEEEEIIVGFGDMDKSGYLDRLYVHQDRQGQGIATALVEGVERRAADYETRIFTTQASITARPFFEKQGYRVLRENTVVRSGVALMNFVMEKRQNETWENGVV